MGKTVIALNCADYSDIRKRRNQESALEILESNLPDDADVFVYQFPWENVDVPDRFYIVKKLSRNSREVVGNNRDLPYIKEILKLCAEEDCEVFGYMNSDVIVSRGFFSILSDFDAYVFYRREIGDTNPDAFNAGKYHRVWGGDGHLGNDAFFFDRIWWENNESLFPSDLILGETEWDTCYRTIIVNSTQNYYVGRDLCHVLHDQKWNTTSPGALNNINIMDKLSSKYIICRNALQ